MRFDALPDTPLRLVHQGFEGLKRARWIDVAGKGLGFIVATDTRPSTLSVRLPTTDYLGGPHRLHGPYDAFAALNDVGILLLRRQLQLPRWYFLPVRVTQTVTSAFSVLAGGVNAASGSADGQGVVTSGTAATFAALAVGRQAAGSSAMTAAFVAPTEMLTPLSQPAVAGGRTIIFDEQATPAPDDELLADLLVTSNP